ncbi:MAG: hypothetical protein Q8R57_16305 [Bacteroidota bacterium]|nr:hypothetical protein [Bacteroidota bacterium]
MRKLGFFAVCLAVIMACVQPKIRVTHAAKNLTTPSTNRGTVVFIQSTDIIASRVAQDQFTRIFAYPSTQAYVFMNKSYIDSFNVGNYQAKMGQQNVAYIVCMHVQELPEPSFHANFLDAYTQHFAKLMYNPIYKYTAAKAYVQVSVYEATTRQLLWQGISGQVPVEKLPQYLQKMVPRVQKELEKANYFSIKKSKR